MPDKESAVIKVIKKLYDITVESSHISLPNKLIVIKVYISFTPKEIKAMSPELCLSCGKWVYNIESGQLSLSDFTYIRNDTMPILSFMPVDYFLDSFCEDSSVEEVNRVLISLGYDVSFSLPNPDV
jgi:hypothetical protein